MSEGRACPEGTQPEQKGRGGIVRKRKQVQRKEMTPRLKRNKC